MWAPVVFLIVLLFQDEKYWPQTAKNFEALAPNISVFNLRIPGEFDKLVNSLLRATSVKFL